LSIESHIEFEQDGALGIVTMNRPPVNAFVPTTYQQILATFERITATEEIGVVILTGAGRAFSAGVDIKDPAGRAGNPALWRATLQAVRDCAAVTIAAINGASAGAGCALALQCDIRVAADSARLGYPELRVGLAGGAGHLSRVANAGAIRELMLTAELVSAEHARELGLINHVWPSAELLDRSRAMAATILKPPVDRVRTMKRLLNEIESLPEHEQYLREQQLTAAWRLERGDTQG
jgi:enoyl-CoA hydratase/carnithine racemase